MTATEVTSARPQSASPIPVTTTHDVLPDGFEYVGCVGNVNHFEVASDELDRMVTLAEALDLLVHATADECTSWACDRLHVGGTSVTPRRGYDSLVTP